MRIGNQFDSNASQRIRVDQPDRSGAAGAASGRKPSSASSNVNVVKSDVEVLLDEMSKLKEDRSELLAQIKGRIANGDYFTAEAAENTAEAILKSLEKT